MRGVTIDLGNKKDQIESQLIPPHNIEEAKTHPHSQSKRPGFNPVNL